MQRFLPPDTLNEEKKDLEYQYLSSQLPPHTQTGLLQDFEVQKFQTFLSHCKI